ncbi:hypothetical protein EYF80_048948 [Liparis tanakae]|uniref:Uncharacterized protein n=1 Tax=Liparis tanakae TaxID=230148 RepID=A0A4Z2FIU8_9TELE|nr:hypothetical protein EYF80_048948 [Liparis tanakae]
MRYSAKGEEDANGSSSSSSSSSSSFSSSSRLPIQGHLANYGISSHDARGLPVCRADLHHRSTSTEGLQISKGCAPFVIRHIITDTMRKTGKHRHASAATFL